MDRYLLIGVLIGLAVIYRKQHKLNCNIMATKAELLAIAAELGESLTNIGDDITRLVDNNAGNIPDDVVAEFRALADRAKAVADRTPEAESPESPEEPIDPEFPTE